VFKWLVPIISMNECLVPRLRSKQWPFGSSLQSPNYLVHVRLCPSKSHKGSAANIPIAGHPISIPNPYPRQTGRQGRIQGSPPTYWRWQLRRPGSMTCCNPSWTTIIYSVRLPAVDTLKRYSKASKYEYRVKTAALDTLKRYSILSLTLYLE
jgi:hypothetical protein